MLRVTVEMLPGGDERGKWILASLLVINDATGTKAVGNYDVYLYDEMGVHEARVEHHRRVTGAVRLVAKALRAALREPGRWTGSEDAQALRALI